MKMDWIGGTTLRMAYPSAHFGPKWFFLALFLFLAVCLLQGSTFFGGVVFLTIAAAIGLFPFAQEFHLDKSTATLTVVARSLLLRKWESLRSYALADLVEVKVRQKWFALGSSNDYPDPPTYCVRLCFRSGDEIVISCFRFSCGDAIETAQSIARFPGVEATLDMSR